MAQKGLFFNALPDSTSPTGYDRNYSADDISDWFSIVCTTGVLKNGLAVSAGTGLSVNVAVGKATIQGKGYVNNAIVNLTGLTAPTGSTPYYYPIKLQMNNMQTASGRVTQLVVGSALSSVPTISNLTQTDTIYELMLAYAVVQPNATSISQIVDTRGQAVCPWFTAVKGYDDYYDAIVQQFQSVVTLSSSSVNAVTDLPSNLYNNKYSLIEVYVNGLREDESNYTANTSNGYISITFTTTKNAGAEILVVLNNFIDGEGLPTAIAQYTQWVQDVADLKAANNYTYVCNGATDNVAISNLVNTFVNGGTDYGSLNLKIVGTFGYTAFAAGSGTSASPYRLFNFTGGNRKVNLDFTNCSQISVTANGTWVWVFYASNYSVKGLNLVATGTTSGSCIRCFYSSPNVEDSRIWINGYENSWIAQSGTFTNCRCSVSNASGNSYCFLTTNLLRVNGGEYYAYTGSSSSKSAVVGQSTSNAVSILYAVNAPTSARTGYYQTNAIYQTGTNYVNCTDIITQLTLTVVTGYSNVRGTIPYSIN